MRHSLSQFHALDGMGRTNNGTYFGVAVFTDGVFAPLGYQVSNLIVHIGIFHHLILQFTAGGVGGSYQNENTLFVLSQNLQEGFDAIYAQIRIDGDIVFLPQIEVFAFDVAATDVASVTIVGTVGSADCDALSTTCLILGLEDGMELIESIDGVEADELGEEE